MRELVVVDGVVFGLGGYNGSDVPVLVNGTASAFIDWSVLARDEDAPDSRRPSTPPSAA